MGVCFVGTLILSCLLSWALFPEVSTSGNGNRTGPCEPRDCSQAPRFKEDLPFPCSIRPTDECGRFPVSGHGSRPQGMHPARLILPVVYQLYFPEDNKSYPTLNVSVQLPNDLHSLRRTKAVRLDVDSPDDKGYNRNKPCRMFDFRNATFTEYDATHPRILSYPCFYWQEAATYKFKLTTLPDNLSITYYTTVSVFSQDDKWRSSLMLWQPEGIQELWVMFGRHLDVSSYKLVLYTYNLEQNGCGVVHKSQVVETVVRNKNENNTVVFRNLKTKSYFIVVSPQGCAQTCASLTSYCYRVKKGIQVTEKRPGDRSKPTDNSASGVIIEHVAQDSDKGLKSVLGVFCGVTFGVLLIILLVYLYKGGCRKCNCCGDYPPDDKKEEPTVLLLYSPDCAPHKTLVEKLALVLIEAFVCNVQFELFQLNVIQKLTLLKWLQEKISTSDYIIFVCSVGGRLQCNRNDGRLKLTQDYPLEDYFSSAVEVVKANANVKPENVIILRMGYSTPGDIPPKLDYFRTKFVISEGKDLAQLYQYIRKVDKMPREVRKADSLNEFQRALEDCYNYFENNSDWTYELMSQGDSQQRPGKNATRSVTRMNNEQICDDNQRDVIKYENSTISTLSRSNSHPHSLQSSIGSNLVKLETSRSIPCLDKNKSIIDDDIFAQQHLLRNKSQGHGLNSDSESECEETIPKSVSMPVDVHCAGDTGSVCPSTSGSEESDIAITIQHIVSGPDREGISRIVHANYANGWNDRRHSPLSGIGHSGQPLPPVSNGWRDNHGENYHGRDRFYISQQQQHYHNLIGMQENNFPLQNHPPRCQVNQRDLYQSNMQQQYQYPSSGRSPAVQNARPSVHPTSMGVGSEQFMRRQFYRDRHDHFMDNRAQQPQYVPMETYTYTCTSNLSEC